MTTTTRTAALGALAALMLAIGSPRDAAAHPVNEYTSVNVRYVVPPAFNVRRDADSPHDSIVVTWNEAHAHPPARNGTGRMLDYRIFVREVREEQIDPQTCAHIGPNRQPSDGCIRRIVSLDGPNYSETITGLQPDRPYFVWHNVRYVNQPYSYYHGSGEQYEATAGYWRYRKKTITTLPRQTTATPTTPAHPHPFAPADHSHADLKHGHPFASSNHRHSTHDHPFAAADHTHDGSTGTSPGASTTAAQTCPRFIELVSPYTYLRNYARELDGSVWIAVHAIEYLMEKTVPANSVGDVAGARVTEGIEGVMFRLMEPHDEYRDNTGKGREYPRAFIDEGANLADVAASVRCQSAPVAVTTEDPPAPGTQ